MSSLSQKKRKRSSSSAAAEVDPEMFNVCAVQAFTELVKVFPDNKYTESVSTFFYQWNSRKMNSDGDVGLITSSNAQILHDLIFTNMKLQDAVSKSDAKDHLSVIDFVAVKIKKMLRNCRHQQQSRERTRQKTQKADDLIQLRCLQADVSASLMTAGILESARLAYEAYKLRQQYRVGWKK